jgi:LL-diaminopimelate aminotransferase
MKNNNYINNNFAQRIGGKQFGVEDESFKAKKNKFVKIIEAKNQAIKENPDIEMLDFGVGEADEMADPIIREELKKQVDVFENRGYADNGIYEFKKACATFMKNQLGVKLDPSTQINHCIGAKSGLAILPLAFIEPGDTVIMTSPGYPIFGTNSEYLGAEIFKIPLKKENRFIPDIHNIPEKVLKKAKVMVINYPNSPTGAVVGKDFYEEIIKIAKKYEIIVIQDAAYSMMVYNTDPISFLSVNGAMDVGIEVHSLSKLFNMTGWRLGFIAGNELIVKAFAMLKDNIDCGQFKAIQKAGIKALENPQITDKLVIKYRRRLEAMVGILKSKGFDVQMPGGSYFLYVEIPKGIKNGPTFDNAEQFSQWLIREKLISNVPWDDAGNFFRMSATFIAEDIEKENAVLKELKNRLDNVEFYF